MGTHVDVRDRKRRCGPAGLGENDGGQQRDEAKAYGLIDQVLARR